MASRDNKKSMASRDKNDLNRPSADSDSDSDDHQVHYTGDENSGMFGQDPSIGNDVDEIFNAFRQDGAVERPFDQFQEPPSRSTSFPGTARLLSGEIVQSASQQPKAIVYNIVFWTNGFTVNDGPLRSLDDPENAPFLESLKRSEYPNELEPVDDTSSVQLNLVRRIQKYPEPEKPVVPFQGLGRTLRSSAISVSFVRSSFPRAAPAPYAGLVVDQSLPATVIQMRLFDGTRMRAHFNLHHTVGDVRAFINSSRPAMVRDYQLRIMGFPTKLLTDESQTIEQAGLANSVVVQKL